MTVSGSGYVVFKVGSEGFALPVASVSSIIRYEPTTPVPRAPQSVLGVVNIRGRVIPVVDVARRFNGVPFVPASTARIIIAEGAVGPVGLAVDAACEVVEVPQESIRPVPDGALSSETVRAFTGVVERDGELIVLIDLDEAVPRVHYADAVGLDIEGGDEDV